MTRSAPNRLAPALALAAAGLALQGAAWAQALQPAYPDPVDDATAQPRERDGADAPAAGDDGLPYGDWLDGSSAEAEPGVDGSPPYGDILLFADEAALDLRAETSVAEQLLRLEFGDALPRPMPSDTWMSIGDLWLRVEPLPFRADAWTRVRLRVGDFGDEDVERAEALLSTLALRLADRLEAEQHAASLDVDGILADAGVALDDGSTSSEAAEQPSYFDSAWIATAYASDPVQASDDPGGEGWVRFWSPTWGWWYVPADQAPELAAWLAVDDAPTYDAGTQVVVIHDSSYGYGSCASVCSGYGYGYGGYGYGYGSGGWSSGWGVHYGSPYGSSWSWGLLGQYTHHASYSPWYSPWYACDPWWWSGCSPWWWTYPSCEPWIDVDVTVNVPGDDLADGDDGDDGEGPVRDGSGGSGGVGDDGVGGLTRRQLLADGRDRTQTRDEPQRGGKPTVEADPVLTRRTIAPRPVSGLPEPVSTPVRRAPVSLGGLRSRPVVRSSVPMPDFLRRGPIGTTPVRPSTPVARAPERSVTLQPWPAPVASRPIGERGGVPAPTPYVSPVLARTPAVVGRAPTFQPTPISNTPSVRTSTPVLRSSPSTTRSSLPSPAPAARTSRPSVTHTPSATPSNSSPRASPSRSSGRSGSSGSSSRSGKTKTKNR